MNFSANFNEVPFCLLDGPMNLVFYLETSYNSKQYQLVFYKHLILSVIKKFAYMIKAYPAENSIIIKTYSKPYNMEILFDQIWSLPSQFFSQVFQINISQLGSRRPIRTLTPGTELKTKISLTPDEGSYLGSILDQLEGIIENPKNIKHMASQIPKTIERVHDDLKENHPRATAIVLQVINTFLGAHSEQSAGRTVLCFRVSVFK